jgi:hypothetical protein
MGNDSDCGLKPLPDSLVCRTKHIGIKEFSECLVNRPHRCSHSTSFGDMFLCFHPHRRFFEKSESKLK